CVDEAVRDLTMIGLDRVAGYFGAEVLESWSRHGGQLGTVPQITSPELAERLGTSELTVLDVRGAVEWEAGHLPGAENIPLGYVEDHLEAIPRDRMLVVHCQGGG